MNEAEKELHVEIDGFLEWHLYLNSDADGFTASEIIPESEIAYICGLYMKANDLSFHDLLDDTAIDDMLYESLFCVGEPAMSPHFYDEHLMPRIQDLIDLRFDYAKMVSAEDAAAEKAELRINE